MFHARLGVLRFPAPFAVSMTDPDLHPGSQPAPSGAVPAATAPAAGSRHLLLRTVEGRILLVGLVLAALLFLSLGIAWFIAPKAAFVYIVMGGLNLTVGRAAGMSFLPEVATCALPSSSVET